MDIYDVILTCFYLLFIYALALVVKSFHHGSELYQKYFLKGLTAKLLGGFAFAMVYTYYYSYGGDTMAYYRDAEWITLLIFEDPISAFELMFFPDSADGANVKEVLGRLRLGGSGSEFRVVRVTAILNALAMNSYYSTTLLFAALSFVGIWHFFLVFAKRYPQIQGQLAIAILFVPSVFFWGSGIMKDSLVIGYLGLIIYALDKFLKGGMQRIAWAALILYCGTVIITIKAYVIMALAPALVVWAIMNYKDRIKDRLVRVALLPVLLALAVVGVAFALDFLGKYQQRYSVENFVSSAKSIQDWHYVEGENTSDKHGRGSSYTLGDYDATMWGVVTKFPEAVNVTLFRPYLWEVRNAAMATSALESLFIFLFSVYIFLGLGFWRVIKLTMEDPFLLMCFSFAILFAFSVGFTSYNFGALARYKIPCIPFYIASLLILNYKVKELKARKKERLKMRQASISSQVISTQGQFA